MTKHFVSYDQVHNLIKKSADEIKKLFIPDYIVAISGGGLIPSRILRTFVKVPILVIGVSLYDEHDKPQQQIRKTQWFDNPSQIKGKKILIVDEVDDTRKTLEYVVKELQTLEPEDLAIYVLHNKDKPKVGSVSVKYVAAETVPDYWIVYPWDNDQFIGTPKTSGDEKVMIIDFGSQYTQLIARRVRELHVYSEIVPYDAFVASKWKDGDNVMASIKAFIFSGSPFSVVPNEKDAIVPKLDALHEILESKIPVLAICYGAQLLAHELKLGQVQKETIREYGNCVLTNVDHLNPLFHDVTVDETSVWMSHGDSIYNLDTSKVELLAITPSIHAAAAFQLKNTNVYGLQFHPEVVHSKCGTKILRNFLVGIAQCQQNWTPRHVIQELQEKFSQYKNESAVMALSGGVDSTVAALLLKRVVGDNLHCIFVDNGLLRKDEYDHVLETYKELGLNVKAIDAKDYFYSALAGISDPEKKRKAIGKCFIDVFEKEALSIPNVKYLGQGTIYPDVIESIAHKAKTIKSHHNVGGLPEKMNLKVLEPLRLLFKDEVRKVGKELGVPSAILHRHPFPGPGLAIRILGEITPERVHILQQVDHIFINALKEEGLYDSVWQAGAILLNCQSVGVMGDERTYDNVVALRAVNSVDGMTADWAKLDYNFLGHVSNAIINKVKGVNRVVYDISSKPPATIEWE